MDADRPADSDRHVFLEQARAGSKQAVCQLFEAHRQMLRLVIGKRLKQPLRRLFDSEDFTQELFIKFWTCDLPPEVFVSDAAFHAYLTMAAKNILHDYERRFLVFEKHNLQRDVPGENLGATPAPAEPPADEFDMKVRFDQWQKDLPPLQRRILFLKRAGENQRSIAAQLNISERTLRRRLQGLSKLPPLPSYLDWR